MRQIIILLLLSTGHVCFSQAVTEPSFYHLAIPEKSGEKIVLETDRQFYCVDEKIYFTAGYTFDPPLEDVHWSKVIYVELIRWNGENLAQEKFRLYENRASGFLTIPRTLASGNYYLRAYTKWMRNFPVEEYCYKSVKIVNPFDSRIDTGPFQEEGNSFVQLKAGKEGSYTGIECFTNKSIYKKREKVELTLVLEKKNIDYSNYCISVAKAAHIDTNTYFIQKSDPLSPDKNSLIHLPEIRGVSISGKILPYDSLANVANATVHLSTPLNRKYYSTFQTGDNGLFYFTLPDFYGQYDFYIDAVLENGETAQILVDNDFCPRGIRLPYDPFSLDSSEMKIALEMAVNMQLSNMYNEENRFTNSEAAQISFYVRPKQVYYTAEYIQLPNVEEFFHELVREVRIIEISNQTELKLVAYSPYPELKPLVLLDNIPVFNIEELLKLPLERIEKIEIVDEPYVLSG